MDDQICEHCGAKIRRYWHKITPGLVKTLVKVYKRVSEKEQNLVQMNELPLDHSEYGNFQKLRFHALIAKYKENGEWVARQWVITHRGANFLKGIEKIPARVQTYRNHVVGHDLKTLNVGEVMKGDIFWENREDFIHQDTLNFNGGQEMELGKPQLSKTKKKSKLPLCIKCGGINKIKLKEERGQNEFSIKVVKSLQCIDCGKEDLSYNNNLLT